MPSGVDSVWTRDEKKEAGPQPLSRETIVAAAIEIADAEGLEAVSIRRLATKLGARPMSLYSHIERKGDLIDLMIDTALAHAILPDSPPSGDWQEDLRRIAQRTREAIREHPWTIAISFRRPFIGPNALRHLDQSLAAVSPLPLPPERKRAVLLSVDMYTLGFVRWELKALDATKDPAGAGIDDDGPSAAEIDAYIAAQAASGKYPHLHELGGKKSMSLGVKAEAFETGLNWLIAGIEAEVGALEGASD